MALVSVFFVLGLLPRAAGEVDWVLPGAVTLQSCEATEGKLLVSWSHAEVADVYEVQVAASPGGSTILVFTTDETSAELEELLPDRTYWLRVRAHARAAPSLALRTWGKVGAELQCITTGTLGVAAVVSHPDREEEEEEVPSPDSFFLTVMRQSEFTREVDYLPDHNSGDLMASVALLSTAPGAFGHATDDKNASWENVTLWLACVEILNVTVPGTATTGGNPNFADYASCLHNPLGRSGWAPDLTRPSCVCEFYIDRLQSGAHMEHAAEKCYSADDSTQGCDLEQGIWNISSCICECSAESLAYSSWYTGMQPMTWGTPHPFGHWYSHPAASECGKHEQVGEATAPSSAESRPCTWKSLPSMRLVSGRELSEHGWDWEPIYFPMACKEQVDHNFAVMQRVLDSAPLAPWRCGPASSARRTEPRSRRAEL